MVVLSNYSVLVMYIFIRQTHLIIHICIHLKTSNNRKKLRQNPEDIVTSTVERSNPVNKIHSHHHSGLSIIHFLTSTSASSRFPKIAKNHSPTGIQSKTCIQSVSGKVKRNEFSSVGKKQPGRLLYLHIRNSVNRSTKLILIEDRKFMEKTSFFYFFSENVSACHGFEVIVFKLCVSSLMVPLP